MEAEIISRARAALIAALDALLPLLEAAGALPEAERAYLYDIASRLAYARLALGGGADFATVEAGAARLRCHLAIMSS